MSRIYRTKEQARSYWHGVLERWRQSGLTASQFCREHRISESGFYTWRKKLSLVPPAPETPEDTNASFFRIDIPRSTQRPMTLELATGHRLQIADQVNEKALVKVLQALHEAKLC
jgi:hypothetical protein